MDILTMGLILFTGWTTLETAILVKNKLNFAVNKFNDLNLEGYEIQKSIKTDYGKEIIIKIPPGGSTKSLEDKSQEIQKAFKCVVEIQNIPFSDQARISLITKDVGELIYKFIELPPYQLLNGYDYKGNPIITDMLLTPHLLVTGLSGNGKTGMIRIMVENLILNNNVDIMLLNAFMDDYEGFNLNHILDHEEIKNFIEELLQGIEQGQKRMRPLYVIFEELGKVKDKDLINLTTKLLQYGRHNKIYLIGVIQTATKEELKFKSLFNARLTFKQLEESSYRVVLGCSIDEKLKKREFYLFTDDLHKGKTYKLDF